MDPLKGPSQMAHNLGQVFHHIKLAMLWAAHRQQQPAPGFRQSGSKVEEGFVFHLVLTTGWTTGVKVPWVRLL